MYSALQPTSKVWRRLPPYQISNLPPRTYVIITTLCLTRDSKTFHSVFRINHGKTW
jgi:hypothetical protein